MARKTARIEVVPLKEALRYAKEHKKTETGNVIRERRKTEPYVVTVAPRKGGRE